MEVAPPLSPRERSPALPAPDVRALLRAELERRIRLNPRYSLRAWAKALGISHSLLSLILSGKRSPSRKTCMKLAEVLGLGPVETAALLNAGTAVALYGEENVSPSTLYRQISVDTFAIVSDWYHYAILSLLDVPGARFEARWIAGELGITEMEARLAMDRLLRLRLVKRVGRRWKQSGLPLKVENTISTSATRNHHRQLLKRALHSLENDAVAVRDFSNMTFAMDPKSVPYALKRIREFRRSLMAELQAMGTPRTVYHLSVQIYPVSKYPKPVGEERA